MSLLPLLLPLCGSIHVNSITCLAGVILLDSHNIKDLDLRFLRENIGAVSQEPSLFTGTIKDNIRVGNMDADDEAIKNAAIMANAHNFIEQLPDQYQTQVIHLATVTIK